MADYINTTTLYTDATNVMGLDATQNNLDLTDYNNNYRSSTAKISSVLIAATTFETFKSYTDFKALITSPLTWADVKEVDHGNHYDLYLVT